MDMPYQQFYAFAIVGTFYEKELLKTNETQLMVEKVTKSKCDKLYIKGKGDHNSFNSCINMKDIV